MHARTTSLRGRVDAARTLKSLATGAFPPIHTRLRPSTFLTNENRLLSTASAQLIRLGAANPADVPVLHRWGMLAKGTYTTEEELNQIAADLRRKRYTGSRSYYVPAMLMARLILSEGGLAIEGQDNISVEAILMDVAKLYEKYIRILVSRALSQHGFLVEKNQVHALPMFLDGTCHLIPDVIVSRAGRTLLVIDAKYKPGSRPDSSDYYQISAYVEAYKAQAGVIIRALESAAAHQITRRQTPAGRLVYELGLPLGNWEKAEQALRSEITLLARE